MEFTQKFNETTILKLAIILIMGKNLVFATFVKRLFQKGTGLVAVWDTVNLQ